MRAGELGPSLDAPRGTYYKLMAFMSMLLPRGVPFSAQFLETRNQRYKI